jgi:hypothetical protein
MIVKTDKLIILSLLLTYSLFSCGQNTKDHRKILIENISSNSKGRFKQFEDTAKLRMMGEVRIYNIADKL